MWVSVSLIGKVSDSWIKDLGSYTKNWLVFWFDDKELSSGADVISWNIFQKKKKFIVNTLNQNILMTYIPKNR